jgi:short-subunit dehydrogenase
MRHILIVGATSTIAEATAKLYARQGAAFYLLARDQERLSDLANDLKIRGATSVFQAYFEANDFGQHETVLTRAIQNMGQIDLALIAHGSLGDQAVCERNFEAALKEINTNAISVISLLTHLAPYFEERKQGTLAVIGSVAGDRGRRSNYVYGAAKGMVAVFLQGLRNRLDKSGVQVLTIKPGFVETRMTASFKKGFLWTKPECIAEGIERAIRKKKDVVYLPFWWLFLMRAIQAIPESIFKKMSL